jgi:hypothetical protein
MKAPRYDGAMPNLTLNGLAPHVDFPLGPYEKIHAAVVARWSTTASYQQYSGAWNALAYRFHGAVEAGAKFQKSLRDSGAHPLPQQRFQQEEALFNFFSNGFAAFEALFYGLFAIGSFIDPGAFRLETQKEQQRVSPSHAHETFKRAFVSDPILSAFANLFSDPAYQRWRDMRNVLTHRAAPGRRMYVGIGRNDAPPVEWKLNGLPLDAALVPSHQSELASLIADVLSASATFVVTRV